MTEATVAPITREIAVDASVETTFALFTAHLGAWWPLEDHSVHGARGIVAFEGDRLVERFGEEATVWAEVVAWEPPSRLRLSWHPGHPAGEATDVEVTFTPHAGGTLVRLVHTGWERTSRPEESARSYDQGWPLVLGRFGAALAGVLDGPYAEGPARADDLDRASDEGAEVQEAEDVDDVDEIGAWYALVHTPGPALPDGASIFAHPSFGEHVAFLQRLHERGLLVAAGPVVPERGEGMTVVRVLSDHGDVDVEQLARTDDRSVVEGVLEVEVRRWSVRFTG